MSYSDGASTKGPTGGPDSRPKPQYDLFVMHAEADHDWVQGYLLPELGLPQQSIVTPQSFTPGAPIVRQVERAVFGARFTAIVLSAAFLADDWSAFGELLATHASVAGASDRLIPLLLEPCEIPLRVDFRVRLDCTAQARWEPEVARLRALLKELRAFQRHGYRAPLRSLGAGLTAS
jgi:TIR domain